MAAKPGAIVKGNGLMPLLRESSQESGRGIGHSLGISGDQR